LLRKNGKHADRLCPRLDGRSELGTATQRPAGCEKLFKDKASGAKNDRPGLAEALHFARAGDCIVVWELDSSIQSLIALATDLSARKVDF
jgi:DNA invertase Pin-like site-specific DNA recombinase